MTISPKPSTTYVLTGKDFNLKCFGVLNPTASPTTTTGKVTVK